MVEINLIKTGDKSRSDQESIKKSNKMMWHNLICTKMNLNDNWLRFTFMKNIQAFLIMLTLSPIVMGVISFTILEFTDYIIETIDYIGIFTVYLGITAFIVYYLNRKEQKKRDEIYSKLEKLLEDMTKNKNLSEVEIKRRYSKIYEEIDW